MRTNKLPCITYTSICFLISLNFLACGGSNPADSGISQYAGEWTGQTSQNLPVYFRVDDGGMIDSLTVRFRMNFVTFTCTATFAADTLVAISNTDFEVFLAIPITNVSTTLHGTFDTEKSASGTYEPFSDNWVITCGNTLAFGTGGVQLTAGTWSAGRLESGANKPLATAKAIYEVMPHRKQ